LSHIYLEGIPPALRSIPQWLVWNNIVSNDNPRGRKVPIDVKDGGPGSSTDPDRWSDFNWVKIYESFYTGIGFVLVSGIFCIDIDKCYDGNKIDEHATKILDLFEGKTYVELSFHGDGLHIFGFGSLPDKERGGERGGIEVYDTGRYIAVTGLHLKTSAIDLTDCQGILDEIIRLYPRTPLQEKKNSLSKKYSSESISDRLGIQCTSITMPTKPVKRGSNIWMGGHPFHGSTTGTNFKIEGNQWHCFRHLSGGGPLELFAMKEGIIQCGDAGPGCLSNKWPEVFAALKENGYDLVKAGIESPLFRKRLELMKELGIERRKKCQ
jgi:hypothetical protein